MVKTQTNKKTLTEVINLTKNIKLIVEVPPELSQARSKFIKNREKLIESFIRDQNKSKETIDLISIMYDSFNRFECFLRLKDHLPDDLYWYCLRETYTDSDNLFSFKQQLKDAFSSNRKNRNNLMIKDELNVLKKLPERVHIYRGMTKSEFDSKDFGVSWTLSKKVADFFANKYWRNLDTNGQEKLVVKLQVNKKDIVAYFHERKEDEVIFLKKIESARKIEVFSSMKLVYG